MVEDARITNNTYGIWLTNSYNTIIRKNTVWNNTNGIYVIAGTDNAIAYNYAFNNTQYGIWLSGVAFSTFRGNNATGSAAGFIIGGSHNNLFENNYSYHNIDDPNIQTGYGFRITSSYNNIFRNNTIFKVPFGMVFEVSGNNFAVGNNSTMNLYGMGLEGQNTNNTLTANLVTKNDFGIYAYNSSQNLIYNNYLENLGNAYDTTLLNYWNTTKSPGPNILGGPFLGGNFYSDYRGTDADADGIGDSPHNISDAGQNKDFLPLVIHDIAAISVTAQPSNPFAGQVVDLKGLFRNRGTYTESFTVTVYNGPTVLGMRQITDLPPGSESVFTVQWNTTGLQSGTYEIQANASIVPGEINTSNNVSPPVTVTMRQNFPPVANFTYAPPVPNPEQIVSFDASPSHDPDNDPITSYAWNFGNGQSGNGIQVSHAFANPGTFTVTLTLTDPYGVIVPTERQVRVNAAPSAEFNVPATPMADDPVSFNASGSTDPDGTITRYVWDFGDGQTATTPNPFTSHIYESSENYTVTLTVYDNNEVSTTTSKRLSVLPRPPSDPVGSPGQPSDPLFMASIITIAALLLAGVGFVVRSKKKRQSRRPAQIPGLNASKREGLR